MRTPRFIIALIGIAELLFASPGAKASATIAGKRITIKYGAPSVRGRQIFGDAGLLSTDWTYPVWRAGANAATTLTTGGDLDVGGLHVPAGSYSLYVLVEDPDSWKLIVNRQTGQGGHIYSARMDLGRVVMKMDRPKSTGREAPLYDHDERKHGNDSDRVGKSRCVGSDPGDVRKR